MKNLHHKINLRALLIDAETKSKIKIYGKDSATVKGKYFYPNIGIFISYLMAKI